MAAILSTSFAVAVTDWATTWQLASVTGVQIGHLCVAESEVAQVMKVGPATTIIVRRGVEATGAAAHPMRTPVTVYRADDVQRGPSIRGPAAAPWRQVAVTLTDTQIRTLGADLPSDAEQVHLVPTAGPDQLLLPFHAMLISNFVAPYSNISATDAQLGVDGCAGSLALLLNDEASHTNLSLFLGSATRQVVVVGPDMQLLTDSLMPPITGSFNPGGRIILWGYNGDGAFTGGHASNTLLVSVAYLQLDLATGLFV